MATAQIEKMFDDRLQPQRPHRSRWPTKTKPVDETLSRNLTLLRMLDADVRTCFLNQPRPNDSGA